MEGLTEASAPLQVTAEGPTLSAGEGPILCGATEGFSESTLPCICPPGSKTLSLGPGGVWNESQHPYCPVLFLPPLWMVPSRPYSCGPIGWPQPHSHHLVCKAQVCSPTSLSRILCVYDSPPLLFRAAPSFIIGSSLSSQVSPLHGPLPSWSLISAYGGTLPGGKLL